MIIGVTGLIGSGKNTISKYLVGKYGFINFSFAGVLKDVCSVLFGWQRYLLEGDTEESRMFRETVDDYWSKKLHIPNFTPRLALQLVGTNCLRKGLSEDIWVSALERRINNLPKDKNVVISDVRFPNELKMIHSNGFIIRCIRELPEWWDDAEHLNVCGLKSIPPVLETIHESEWKWIGIDYPRNIISNTGTLEDLYNNVDTIIGNTL